MTARWFSRAGLVTILLGALAGCVERRYTVITEPASAMVLENGRPVGPAPLQRPFDYYGLNRFQFQRDGCQTVLVDEDITAPWYAYPPFDFITENLLPWTIRDIREFRYTLPQMPAVPDEQAIGRAIQLQQRAIGFAPRVEVIEQAPPPQKVPGVP